MINMMSFEKGKICIHIFIIKLNKSFKLNLSVFGLEVSCNDLGLGRYTYACIMMLSRLMCDLWLIRHCYFGSILVLLWFGLGF